MNFINETNERIEKRVMALEANLLALGVLLSNYRFRKIN